MILFDILEGGFVGQACPLKTCSQFKVICCNGIRTWENESHTDIETAIESARSEPGSMAYELKDGKYGSIGKVTAAWVEDDSGRKVWPVT